MGPRGYTSGECERSPRRNLKSISAADRTYTIVSLERRLPALHAKIRIKQRAPQVERWSTSLFLLLILQVRRCVSEARETIVTAGLWEGRDEQESDEMFLVKNWTDGSYSRCAHCSRYLSPTYRPLTCFEPSRLYCRCTAPAHAGNEERHSSTLHVARCQRCTPRLQ